MSHKIGDYVFTTTDVMGYVGAGELVQITRPLKDWEGVDNNDVPIRIPNSYGVKTRLNRRLFVDANFLEAIPKPTRVDLYSGSIDKVTGWEAFRLATQLPPMLVDKLKGPL